MHLALVDEGWVIAYCHIRGGSEKGREWYNGGRLLNKANTYYDFLDCARHLVQEGYCHFNYMAAYGSSAGGTMLAQAVNICPSFFRAVVLSHPFLDVLSTLLDDTLPLTVSDYKEFGNPRKSEEEYRNIIEVSPYENILNMEYPG